MQHSHGPEQTSTTTLSSVIMRFLGVLQHCGAGAAKKWKASLRVEPGSVPEVPRNANPMPVGRWMEMKGIEVKTSVRTPSGSKPPVSRVILEPKIIEERPAPPAYAPWTDMANKKHVPIKVGTQTECNCVAEDLL